MWSLSLTPGFITFIIWSLGVVISMFLCGLTGFFDDADEGAVGNLLLSIMWPVILCSLIIGLPFLFLTYGPAMLGARLKERKKAATVNTYDDGKAKNETK